MVGDVLPVVPRTSLTSSKEAGGTGYGARGRVLLGNVGPTLRSVSGGDEWWGLVSHLGSLDLAWTLIMQPEVLNQGEGV